MPTIIRWFLLLLITINIAYVISGIAFNPIQSQDAYGIWLLKAKAIWTERGLPLHYLHAPEYSYSHQQYPLLLPTVLALMYAILGGIHEQTTLLIVYPTLYAFILFLSYRTLRLKLSPIPALLATYAYSMLSPLLAGSGRVLAGGADVFIAAIVWAILYLFLSKPSKSAIVAICVLIATASQIKLEGIFLLLFIFLLPLSKRNKVILSIVTSLPFLGWIGFVHFGSIHSSLAYAIPSLAVWPTKILTITSDILKELLNKNNWYGFWVLFGVSLFLQIKKQNKPPALFINSTLLLVFGMIMLGYVLIYFISTIDAHSYVSSSFDRILLQHSAIPFLWLVQTAYASMKVVYRNAFNKKNIRNTKE